MTNVTYLGHSGFLIESDGKTVVIDPFLTDNPTAARRPEDLDVDAVLVTHGHFDHVGDGPSIAKRCGATLVGTFELVSMLGETEGLETGHPMHIGGAHDFDFGRVKMTIAHHGSLANNGTYCGDPAGYLLWIGGKLIYHAGDTALTYDMKLIGDLYDVDLALLPIGDNFTMGIDDAVHSLGFVRPKHAIPMHYGTWDVIDVDPAAFVTGAAEAGYAASVLAPGDSHRL